MALRLRVVHFLAAALLYAAWLVPAPASAHEGHAHHAAAPVSHVAIAPAAGQAGVTRTAIAPRAEIARAATVWPIDREDGGCASHCCGGSAGMTCCAAALVPEFFLAPTFGGSLAFLVAGSGALLGLPPEALPKPPKSFG